MNDSTFSVNSSSLKTPRILRALALSVLIAGAAMIAIVLAWKGVTAAGVPDPTEPNSSPIKSVLDIALLVFREGLECILVLSALTASMRGADAIHKKPVFLGAGVAFLATILTWFIVVGILSDLMESMPALQVQAWTGLLAIVVLLVVMNWFFHKVYWGGWITLHNRKKNEILAATENREKLTRGLVLGLGFLGFTSLYREGFEIVLFLQSYHLRMGGDVVLMGCLVGLFFSGIVAVLNFVAHRRLPYRKMLVFTGILLGAVLLVMVGEQGQEMQLAGWIPKTEIPALVPIMPEWVGMWFAFFPTVETLAGQGIAAALVIGSYFLARRGAKTARQEAPGEGLDDEAGLTPAVEVPRAQPN